MHSTLPRVSIVTPSFNQAEFLETTIKSVLDQDYPNVEYLVVDGGSTDSSVEIIQKYASKLAWWVSESDRGQADAINKGFQRASGEIWAWLNSDDIYYPGAISQAVASLIEFPESGMVYSDADLIDASGSLIGSFPSRQTSYRKMLDGFVHIPQQTTFIRSEHWQKVGGLDPAFFFAMDYDLWVKLAKITHIRYIPKLWAAFRLHGAGKSVRYDERCYPEMLLVRERELGKGLSLLRVKAFLRSVLYTRLPIPLRTWIRKYMPW